jgi:Tfp pilus assembly protein PilF
MLHALITLILTVVFAGTILLGCSSHRNEEAATMHRSKARDFVEKQQFHEALVEYQELLKLDPRDDDAYYQSALLHLRSGTVADINLAHQALLKVVKLKGSRIDAHVQLAQLYFLSGEPDKAGLQADAILDIEPTHSNGHVIKGLSLIAEGRMQKGIAEFNKAIELNPDNRAAYIELARAYAQQRKFSEAETVLQEALKTQSQFTDARIALGDVYQSAGKEAEAIQEYRRGLEEDKNNGTLYARLAAVHQKAHRLEEGGGACCSIPVLCGYRSLQ